MRVQEQIRIRSDLFSVYDAFADIEMWKETLPDVIAVTVLYDDGYHQEFEMTVARPGGPETVRAVRYCVKNKIIDVFQPVPPPLFERMSGTWHFMKCKNEIIVTALRDFFPKEFAEKKGIEQYREKLKIIKKQLKQLLKHNLILFKERLEHAAN